MGKYYYRYYEHYPKTEPISVEDGIKFNDKLENGDNSWWYNRWIKFIKSFRMGARLERGKRYAKMGQVTSISINKGAIIAEVQGSSRKPYEVSITIKPISSKSWEIIFSEIVKSAKVIAMLLNDKIPKEIESIFDDVKIPLFPINKSEFDSDCSCPDFANPCKHIAAVYYVLAEKFNENPFLLFLLRGKSKDEILSHLRNMRSKNGKLRKNGNADQNTIKDTYSIQNIRNNIKRQGVSYFWNGMGNYTEISYDITPETKSPRFKQVIAPYSFEFLGNQGSIHLQEVYYPVQKSLEQFDLIQEQEDDCKTLESKNSPETVKVYEELIDFLDKFLNKETQDIELLDSLFKKLGKFSSRSNSNLKNLKHINTKLIGIIDQFIQLPSSSRPDFVIVQLILKTQKLVNLMQTKKALNNWQAWFSLLLEKNRRLSRLMRFLREANLINQDNEII